MRVFCRGLFVALLSCLYLVGGVQASLGPDQVVERTTEKIMEIVESARAYHTEDPERFYREIDGVMAEVVDYGGFARGVMGTYASRQRYASLKTPEQKEQFKAQVQRFTEIFRGGLTRTYAKGVLAFNGQRVEVVPVSPESLNGKSVNVLQRIHAENDKTYEIIYKMKKSSDGSWRLLNVTIEGINLGVTYRNQFAQSVKEFEGDVDQVIDNWSVSGEKQTAGEGEG